MNDEELEISEPMVQIPFDEYATLLDTDSRVNVLRDFYKFKDYVPDEEVLLILGFASEYDKLKKKRNYTE